MNIIMQIASYNTTQITKFINKLHGLSINRKLGKNPEMKKALRETQTLCDGCSKAEPRNFAAPQTPFPGERDGQNLFS